MPLKPLDLNEALDVIKNRDKVSSRKLVEAAEALAEKDREDYKRLIEAANSIEHNEERLLTTKQASMLMGVSQQTLRNWEKSGKFVPAIHPENGHRRYTEAQVNEFKRREMSDCEILLPNLKPGDLLELVHHTLFQFNPEETINIIVTSSAVRRKVFITVDSEDGLTTVTKTFRMED